MMGAFRFVGRHPSVVAPAKDAKIIKFAALRNMASMAAMTIRKNLTSVNSAH